MLGLQNEREWAAFCSQVLNAPGLAADPRFASNGKRAENKVALAAIITKGFAALTVAQATARLDAAGIANARMNDMAGLWAHPQLAARQRWRQVQTPAGAVPALIPAGWGEGEPRMGPVPALGAQSAAILQELGYDPAAIAGFAADGVI